MKPRVKKIIKSKVANKKIVEEKQAQIVRAAGDLMAARGFHATSMRDISQASGINLSYLYNFITSKDDILYLYYQRLQQEWHDLYQKAFEDRDADPVEQIKCFLRLGMDHSIRVRKEILTLYSESRHLKQDSLQQILANERAMVDVVDDVVKRGIERGVFKLEDSFIAANIIQYLFAMHALRGWNFKDRYSTNRYKNTMINMILRGLGAEPDTTAKKAKRKTRFS